jgi:hypothetical protein
LLRRPDGPPEFGGLQIDPAVFASEQFCPELTAEGLDQREDFE